MKSSVFLFILFWVVLFIDCSLIMSGNSDYRIYTKTLLVPILLINIYSASLDTKHKISKALINLAFLFCFLGDFSLLWGNDNTFFILGLISFLLAHICFCIFFYRLKKFTDKYRLFLFAAGFLTYGYIGFLLFLNWQGIMRQNMQVPVIIYGVIIGSMLLTAIHSANNKSIKRLARIYFIPGALLFIISDSILALHKFSLAVTYGLAIDIVIMVTYATAIFLLAMGAIRFLKK